MRVACGTWHKTEWGPSIIRQALTRQDNGLVSRLPAQSTPRIQLAMREDYLSITLALIEAEPAELAIRQLDALGQVLATLLRSERIPAKGLEVGQGHLAGKGARRGRGRFRGGVPAEFIAGLIKPGTSCKEIYYLTKYSPCNCFHTSRTLICSLTEKLQHGRVTKVLAFSGACALRMEEFQKGHKCNFVIGVQGH